MRHFLLIITLVAITIFLPTVSWAQANDKKPANPREFEMEEGDTTYIMKQYFMAIYLKGPNRENMTKEQVEEIQKGHLANINKYAESGQITVAGPFGDDTEKRGILIFDVDTQEEAEAILKEDPAVKSGRLIYEIHPWWAAKGTILK